MTTKSSSPTRARSAAAREAKARRMLRVFAIAGGVPVTLVAGYASYFHTVALACAHGQSQSTAHLMPVAIDGLMIVAAVAVIAHRNAWLPKIAFGAGALLTLGANVLSVHTPDPVAYVIAGTPALALLLSAELLLRLCLPAAPKRRLRKPAPKTRAARSPRVALATT
jgi:hypothetical protein